MLMKEAIFEGFFSFFVKDGVPQGFLYSVLCICMYKHIYTNRHPSVSSVKGLRAPPPPPPPHLPTARARQK